MDRSTEMLPQMLPDVDESTGIEPLRIPPYKVIFLDDPKTSMEFVIRLLIGIFGKDPESAARLMWEVHTQGASHVTTLSKEQAELKQQQVHAAARAEGFPLRCIIEPA